MGRSKKWGDENNSEIKRLYVEENLSLKVIGNRFGSMHPEIVKRKLIKMGVTIRDKSSAMKIHHDKKRGVLVNGSSESNESRIEG